MPLLPRFSLITLLSARCVNIWQARTGNVASSFISSSMSYTVLMHLERTISARTEDAVAMRSSTVITSRFTSVFSL